MRHISSGGVHSKIKITFHPYDIPSQHSFITPTGTLEKLHLYTKGSLSFPSQETLYTASFYTSHNYSAGDVWKQKKRKFHNRKT